MEEVLKAVDVLLTFAKESGGRCTRITTGVEGTLLEGVFVTIGQQETEEVSLLIKKMEEDDED